MVIFLKIDIMYAHKLSRYLRFQFASIITSIGDELQYAGTSAGFRLFLFKKPIVRLETPVIAQQGTYFFL